MKSIRLHATPISTPGGGYYLLNHFTDEPLKLSMLETLQYVEENNIFADIYRGLPLNPISVEDLIKIANGEVKQKRKMRR